MSKISQYPDLPAPKDGDQLVVVDNSGSPVTKNTTRAQFLGGNPISGATISGSTIQYSTVSGAAVEGTSFNDNGTLFSSVRAETFFDFVASGLVITADAPGSSLNASMAGGVVYIGGTRIGVSSVNNHAYTASKDTYVDIDNTGVPHYTEVNNNALSPTLAANRLRIAIVVTGATSIAAATSINQGQETMVLPIASSVAYTVTDPLGNLICPRDPQRKILGYRQVTSNQGSITTAVDITGLSCPVTIPTNRKVLVSGFIPAASNNTGGAASVMNILDATASAQITQSVGTSPLANSNLSLYPSQLYTPPVSGARTFKAQGQNSAGGTMSTNASSTAPAWIKVELV